MYFCNNHSHLYPKLLRNFIVDRGLVWAWHAQGYFSAHLMFFKWVKFYSHLITSSHSPINKLSKIDKHFYSFEKMSNTLVQMSKLYCSFSNLNLSVCSSFWNDNIDFKYETKSLIIDELWNINIVLPSMTSLKSRESANFLEQTFSNYILEIINLIGTMREKPQEKLKVRNYGGKNFKVR